MREQIDRLDERIIQLIRRRIDASRVALAERLSTGGRSIEMSRENQVIGRYADALGDPGIDLARALVAHGRRPGHLPAEGLARVLGEGKPVSPACARERNGNARPA